MKSVVDATPAFGVQSFGVQVHTPLPTHTLATELLVAGRRLKRWLTSSATALTSCASTTLSVVTGTACPSINTWGLVHTDATYASKETTPTVQRFGHNLGTNTYLAVSDMLSIRNLVPGGGVEPPRSEDRRILSPLRLPVPPSRRRNKTCTPQVSHIVVGQSPCRSSIAGQSHAAPRTPLESPNLACKIGVSASPPNT